MKQFEYKTIEFMQAREEFTETRLNELGKEGWELVAFALYPHWKAIFKRPIIKSIKRD